MDAARPAVGLGGVNPVIGKAMHSRLRTYLTTRAPAWLGLAATLLATGCDPTLPGQDIDAARDLQAQTLVAGESDVRLHAGRSVHVFEVEVAAEQDLEIIASPTTAATLGIGFAESSDGRNFTASPGARLRSSDGRFRVEPQSSGDGRTGFRFVGAADAAGTWRFSILAQPRLDSDAFAELIGSVDGRENWVAHVVLLIYMLNDQPALAGTPADLLYHSFPQLVILREPLDIVVRVRTGQAGEFVDTTDAEDGTSDGDGDGGGGDGTDGGSDADGNGSADGGGDGGDGGDGGGGSVDDGTPPPQSVNVHGIVRTGDAVPDQTGATFTDFGNPIIDDAGRVAFYAAYTGGSGSGGLYVWEEGPLRRVYDDDPTQTGNVPGMGPDDFFGGFTIRWDSGSPHLAWGSNGRLLFVAHLNGFSQPNALFRWRASDGDIVLVSNAELLRAAIPDSTEDFLPEFYHPGLSNDGTAIFSNRYSYFRQDGSFALFQRGIFTTDGLATQALGVGSVPGQPEIATFTDRPVLLTTHNAGGDSLFQAAYQSIEGNRGVYLLSDGELFRVVDNAPDRSFPGLPDGAQVGTLGEDFEALAIGPEGDIAIDTTLTVDDATRDTVLIWDGSQWRELQGTTGQYASDLLAGVSDDGQTVYLVDGNPFLGDGRSAVDLSALLPAELIGVDLAWEAFGGALNNHGRALLQYQRQPGGTPGLAFWSGERLLVVMDATQPIALESIDTIFSAQQREPDALDRVGTVSDRPEVNRPGLSGMVSNRDECVFRAGWRGPDDRINTADDRQAIFLGQGE